MKKVNELGILKLEKALNKLVASRPWLKGTINKGKLLTIPSNAQNIILSITRNNNDVPPLQLISHHINKYSKYQFPLLVMNGYSPILTVHLTVFKDESAILSIGGSHAVFDGNN